MTTLEAAEATLAQFDRTWEQLEALVHTLDEDALTEVRDPAGWAAKDHLMHVALWEQSLLAKLDGRPRHEALGIDAATDASPDYDAINAAIFGATRQRALKDVLHALRETHSVTRARLAAAVTLLSEAPGYAEHYDQHRGWIEELVRARAS